MGEKPDRNTECGVRSAQCGGPPTPWALEHAVLVYGIGGGGLSHVPQLNNPAIRESEEMKEGEILAVGLHPDPAVNGDQVTISHDVLGLEHFLGILLRILGHGEGQARGVTPEVRVVVAEAGCNKAIVRFPHLAAGCESQKTQGGFLERLGGLGGWHRGLTE